MIKKFEFIEVYLQLYNKLNPIIIEYLKILNPL